MLMRQRRVPVRVGVGLAGRIGRQVLMLMVFVVHVPMFVVERLVGVGVAVSCAKEEHDARGHQRDGDDSRDR